MLGWDYPVKGSLKNLIDALGLYPITCLTSLTKKEKQNIVIYENSEGRVNLEVHVENDTVWLTQKNMARLFDCSVDSIALHLKNIFQEGELFEKSVSEESSVTATDGKNYKTKL